MDTQAIRAQMPTLVSGHVPSNVRSFKFNIFDGQPKVSTLGFHIDPKPFEGKVIATTDDAIVVKTGRAEFAVLDRALVTEVPDEGVKVQVEPYARRRFDGLRADTPEEETAFTSDGKPYTAITVSKPLPVVSMVMSDSDNVYNWYQTVAPTLPHG